LVFCGVSYACAISFALHISQQHSVVSPRSRRRLANVFRRSTPMLTATNGAVESAQQDRQATRASSLTCVSHRLQLLKSRSFLSFVLLVNLLLRVVQ
jgi:hypothetical protein